MTDLPHIIHRDAPVGDAPGRRARIGLILLATDFATEGELARFLPDGRGADADIAGFTTRVPNTNPVSVANLRAMGPELARPSPRRRHGPRVRGL